MTIYRARLMWKAPGEVVENAAVAVSSGQIIAEGKWAEVCESGAQAGVEICDLGAVVLLPGFINAHCHLDYSLCRGQVARAATFAGWIEHMNAYKRSFTEEEWEAAIMKGIDECRCWGTTTVVNIASYTHLLPRLSDGSGLRIWWLGEMIDVRELRNPERLAEMLSAWVGSGQGAARGGWGLSPHAPYTASRSLYLASDRIACEQGLPVSTHAGESIEEVEMFERERGPLHALLSRAGRAMTDCGEGSPFFRLLEAGKLKAPWLIAHGNYIPESALGSMRDRGWSVVHCPGTHKYFNRPPFEVERLKAAGINVCLGTDSLASNDSLSLLAECRRLSREEPGMTAGAVLDMITRCGARALGKQGELGEIMPGACADLIAVPYDGPTGESEEHVVEWSEAIGWMMAGGVEVHGNPRTPPQVGKRGEPL